jgi:hypothetical protein
MSGLQRRTVLRLVGVGGYYLLLGAIATVVVSWAFATSIARPTNGVIEVIASAKKQLYTIVWREFGYELIVVFRSDILETGNGVPLKDRTPSRFGWSKLRRLEQLPAMQVDNIDGQEVSMSTPPGSGVTAWPSGPGIHEEMAVGWPMRCFACEYDGVTGLRYGLDLAPWQKHARGSYVGNALFGHDLGKYVLPYRPVWRGFVFNAILYAAVIAAASFSVRRGYSWFVVRRRFRLGLCQFCRYELGVDGPATCPECGREQRPV